MAFCHTGFSAYHFTLAFTLFTDLFHYLTHDLYASFLCLQKSYPLGQLSLTVVKRIRRFKILHQFSDPAAVVNLGIHINQVRTIIVFFPCLPEPLFFLVYGITVFPYIFAADIKDIPFRELIVIPALSQEFPIRNGTVKPGPSGMVSDIRPFYLQMADNAFLIFLLVILYLSAAMIQAGYILAYGFSNVNCHGLHFSSRTALKLL